MPMLNKIGITIDFNRPRDQTLSFKYSKTEQRIIFKLYRVIPIIFVNNLCYHLYHSVK